MNDDDAVALLDRLAAGLPDPGPLPPGLAASGARRRRRRTTVMVVAAACVVALVVGVVSLVGRDDAAPAPEPTTAFPDPPAGMRWVGLGGVVIAVPVDWLVTNDVCAAQSVPFSVTRGGVAVDCVDPPEPEEQAGLVRVQLSIVPQAQQDQLVACAAVDPGPDACSGSVWRDGVLVQVRTRYADRTALAALLLASVRQVPDGVDLGTGLGREQPPSGRPAMIAWPPIARPGDRIGALFPAEQVRGRAFTLTSDDVTYYLSSGDTPTWNERSMPTDDIGITGPGPDPLVVPDVVAPGAYRLCTANAAEQACTGVTVVSP
ncbi:hypothetical protein GCM10023340_31330 [Nocardioides marinquilinus]|uniref:PASTA domain-containing protein n=1 Tax=Nocardioides marinquilinus TaxID=1210400 RepID=A0ABP9PYE2_9ACTN